MDTEVSEILNKNGNKKSPVARGNYSYCGRLCDQTFYQTS